MTGIEQMFAKLLGLEPEQLKQMAHSFVDTVKNIDARLTNIENKVSDLHNKSIPEMEEENG